MARLVRCPKCQKLLVEYPNVPMYQCGGCGIALRAKYQNAAAGENISQETPPTNHPESQSDHGFSDSGSMSSARETTAKVEIEGEENTLPRHIDSPSLNTGDDPPKFSKKDGDPVSATDMNSETEYQQVDFAQDDDAYDSHEQVENPMNLNASHSIASEEDIADRAQYEGLHDVLKSPATIISSHAYDGSISSSDEAHSMRTPGRKIAYSRRTFRSSYSNNRLNSRSVASSSSNERSGARMMTRFSDDLGRGSSFDSEEFQTVENWMALQKETEAGDLHDKVELLRKIDEVRDHLAKICVARQEREVYTSRGTHDSQQFDRRSRGSLYDHPAQPSYIQAKIGSQHKHQISLKHFPEHAHCTCLHCVEERQLHMAPNRHGHGSYRTHSAGDLNSNSSSSGSLQRSQLKDKPKHHCRPISGAAPFIICEHCDKLLQLPADFLVTRRKIYKLQCGGCNEVLSLPFPAKSRNLSDWGSPPQDHQQGIGPCEREQARDLSSNSFEGRDVKALRLHRLMGYDSASDLLHAKSENDDIGNRVEIPESILRQSYNANASEIRSRPRIPRPGMMS